MSTVSNIPANEEKKEAPKGNEQQAAQPSQQLTIDPAKLPKTRGEWFYEGVKQFGGKGAIIVGTAALGFLARYGKRWYGPVPNPFKMINDGMHKTLFHNSVMPLSKQPEKVQRLGEAVVGTTVLFWGGAAFAPVMKWMENNRENISNWYNRRWGTPEDVQITHERLKDEPKQNWNDVFKGRLAAWMTCFGIMVAGDTIIGKGKLFGAGKPDKYRFDQYEEAFGRWVAGFTKKGQEIWKTPLAKELTEAQKQNTVYQVGKITALDFYVTNIAIIVWSFFSRKSAEKRRQQEAAAAKAANKEQQPVVANAAEPTVSTAPENCAPCRLKTFADAALPAASYAETIAGEKAKAAETSVIQSV
jgi:hypothetical protein